MHGCGAQPPLSFNMDLILSFKETRPSYSNFGFALLGRLLEELVGESFESYVEKNILKPLNMANTGFTVRLSTIFTEAIKLITGHQFTPEVRSKMAVGYFDGTDQPAPLYDLGWEAPAGQMYVPSLETLWVYDLMD